MLKIKELRIQKGLLQQDMANFLGIRQGTYNKYENNKLKITNDIIIKLCLILECTPNVLLGFDEEYKKYIDQLSKIKGE